MSFSRLFNVDKKGNVNVHREVCNIAFGKIRKSLSLSIEGKVKIVVVLEKLPIWKLICLIDGLEKESEYFLDLKKEDPQDIYNLTKLREYEWLLVLNIINDQ